jgi:TRAP-type mannitol/chloroaromatic compound transport system permease small subunit
MWGAQAMIRQFVYGVDQLSRTVGHAFAWSALILMAGTVYEVFTRYVLNDPTSWAFDFSYICYGALFYMAGAYALSRGAHVRCDSTASCRCAGRRRSTSCCTCFSSSRA